MAVLFHVSHAYIAMGITVAVYRRNFTFKLMVVADHIERSRWKMDAAFPILARILNRRRLTCSFKYMEISRRNPHVLLHDEGGRMLLGPDLHGLVLLAVYPKSDVSSKCLYIVCYFLYSCQRVTNGRNLISEVQVSQPLLAPLDSKTGVVHRFSKIKSMMMRKRKGERMQPCLTPVLERK